MFAGMLTHAASLAWREPNTALSRSQLMPGYAWIVYLPKMHLKFCKVGPYLPQSAEQPFTCFRHVGVSARSLPATQAVPVHLSYLHEQISKSLLTTSQSCDPWTQERWKLRSRNVKCRSQAVGEKSNRQRSQQGFSLEQNGRFSASIKDLSALGERWQSADGNAPGASDVAKALASSPAKGLSDTPEQLGERRQAFGTNQLPGRKEVRLFLQQCSAACKT